METFSQLGVPFPLYEAPVEEASDYVGKSRCSICKQADQHCFTLDIGCALMIACPSCGAINGLDTNDRKDAPCRTCGHVIEFPIPAKASEIRICYSCLREGKGAMTKDTEFGMVSWQQAFDGVTNGIPGLRTTEFETVIIDAEDNWIGVRLPQNLMFELLQTPDFSSWQGEIWLFCCKEPMTYLGAWASVAPSLGEEKLKDVFDRMTADNSEHADWIWEGLSNGRGSVSGYIFQCKKCGCHRANYDFD